MQPGGGSNSQPHHLQMFTSNNLSIIDETGRSDVMVAYRRPGPTNKWLLTKQARVALRRRAEQPGQREGEPGTELEDNCSTSAVSQPRSTAAGDGSAMTSEHLICGTSQALWRGKKLNMGSAAGSVKPH
ncbi:hypothetical protein DPEC_G00182770 [Dallia pectoralis]|uniref:Uncharacterized protein n=1 Tax=Dallia pectoralis TaxID=75939 RepID=A0ACC2GB17_DALPE|nr:hypothetical protein DPEC_G00182770 [Dallia pectoralis]